MSTIAKFLDFMKNTFPEDFDRIDKESITTGYDYQFHETYWGFTFTIKAMLPNTAENIKKVTHELMLDGAELDRWNYEYYFSDREHFCGHWLDEYGNDMFEW